MECLDSQIGEVLRWAENREAFVVIAANHGNAESLRHGTSGQLDLQHTLSPALCVVFDKRHRGGREGKGALSDVAPTILRLFDLQSPSAMTGRALV
ncbi:MAG: hypothetical protein R3B54_17355 [Bdellovibrionota bacterium]